jgi:hypothetical protein
MARIVINLSPNRERGANNEIYVEAVGGHLKTGQLSASRTTCFSPAIQWLQTTFWTLDA